jgi:integrase
MAVYRDMFMTAFLTYGRRVSDLLTLQWTDIKRGKIVQKMMKTGAEAGAPVEPELAAIFERYRDKGRKYIFPLLPEGLNETEQTDAIKGLTSNYNRGLTRLAQMAGIQEHISSHTARNSFAVAAYLATRSIVMVQQMLGHKKASTTETYLKSLRPDLFVLEIEAVTASLYSGFRAA